jgi:serine/threonine protein kinase
LRKLRYVLQRLAVAGLMLQTSTVTDPVNNTQSIGLVHLDIKSGNVFLGPPRAMVDQFRIYPTAQLADFGLAVPDGTLLQRSLGTDGWRSPVG